MAGRECWHPGPMVPLQRRDPLAVRLLPMSDALTKEPCIPSNQGSSAPVHPMRLLLPLRRANRRDINHHTDTVISFTFLKSPLLQSALLKLAAPMGFLLWGLLSPNHAHQPPLQQCGQHSRSALFCIPGSACSQCGLAMEPAGSPASQICS